MWAWLVLMRVCVSHDSETGTIMKIVIVATVLLFKMNILGAIHS